MRFRLAGMTGGLAVGVTALATFGLGLLPTPVMEWATRSLLALAR